ncbi:sigma-70 family RNA polymerase sigma factor [Paenibacillus wenxiniae]|uniref:Sigma-70 family RNA polymerase sigma factor n=1 Tax=Paenibacillus wenxiniae TaxID=1636843 RepID=A0ABW4RM69_9BACL
MYSLPSRDLEQLYTQYYALLKAIAYQMIGSHSDAEDIVHDVFEQLANKPLAEIEHVKAYLIRAVTNRSLNILQSARKQRELYPGPWLPEPVVSQIARPTRKASSHTEDTGGNEHGTERAGTSSSSLLPLAGTRATDLHFTSIYEYDAEQSLLQQEQIGYAVMVMLEQLNPVERAVFVLRESFQLDYAEIADYVNKTEVACRKMLSRIHARLQPIHKLQPVDNSSTLAFTEAFLEAARSGNFAPLLHQLREDIQLYTDGGGKVRAALHPIRSRYRVTTFLQGIAGKGAFAGEWSLISVNGTPGLQLQRDRAIVYVLTFAWDTDGQVQHVYMISNPDKLAHIDATTSV